MKKLGIVLIVGFCLSQVSNSQDLKWYTLEEAIALNKENPKKIMVDFYTTWCGWCKKMDAGTFSHPAIVSILNQYYYAVKFNAESADPVNFKEKTYNNTGTGRSTHLFAATYASLEGRIGYPTIVYFDENLNRISVEPGYKTPETLEPLLHFIGTNKYKNMSYTEFLKTFDGSVE